MQAEPGKVYTYDLRFVAPRRSAEEGIPQAVMHTFEHCLATSLRSDSPFADNILYVGPMGCCTGFYLLLNRQVESDIIAGALVEAFDFIIAADTIPAANPLQCGNYLLNDLPTAKVIARKLRDIFDSGRYGTEYPVIEQ